MSAFDENQMIGEVDADKPQELRGFALYRLGRFKSGLVTEKRLVRMRPFGRLAARSVGYVLRDSSALAMSTISGS